MKNFTLGLNIVLVLAVATLFYLHFSKGETSKVIATGMVAKTNGGTVTVAYFDEDSLENNYEYMKLMRTEIRNLQEQKATYLNNLRNDARSKLMEYQKKGNSMSEEEAQRANAEMQQLDNNLRTQEQQVDQELQDASVKRIQEAKKAIEEYLKEYNKTKNFTYILANRNDLIYYKDTTYNITNEIIKGLNEAYKKKKTK